MYKHISIVKIQQKYLHRNLSVHVLLPVSNCGVIYKRLSERKMIQTKINPLTAELNPIRHLLALVGSSPFCPR